MKIFAWIPKVFFVCAAMIMAAFCTARAAGFDTGGIEKALAPREARVIQGPEDRMLVNKGSQDQVEKGDIFCIYASGQAVTDPETGQNLGSYAEPEAFGRVVRTSEKFAEIRVWCLELDCSIEPGQAAVRFKEVPAWFLDVDGTHFSDYTAIRAELSYLDWQGYTRNADPGDAQEAAEFAVVFAAQADRLTLWSGGEVKAVYTGADSVRESPGAAASLKDRPRAGAARGDTGTRGKSAVPGLALPSMADAVKAEDFRAVASRKEVTRNIGVVQTVKTQKPYLLCLGSRKIEARALEGGKRFDYTYEGFGEVVSMSVSGRSLAAVNVYVPEAGMRSVVLKLTGSGFRVAAENLPYVLSFMHSPGDSSEPELWGQRFTPADLLLPAVYRLHIKGGSVNRGEKISVPFGYSLFGAFFADFNGNGTRAHGFFNPGGRLVLYESGQAVWQSNDRFAAGGTDLQVRDPANSDAAPDRVEIWSQPALFRQDGAVLAAAELNRSGLSDFFGGGASQGAVGILKFTGSGYQLRPLADHFQGAIRDVHVWQGDLLICVSEGALLSQKGQSHILALPLAVLERAVDF
ncbi:MAG: hypothetical protein KGY56_05245 [Desulfobacterales bacterium]|nr:hypothetical protein [Desulfobacterales bacterium]